MESSHKQTCKKVYNVFLLNPSFSFHLSLWIPRCQPLLFTNFLPSLLQTDSQPPSNWQKLPLLFYYLFFPFPSFLSFFSNREGPPFFATNLSFYNLLSILPFPFQNSPFFSSAQECVSWFMSMVPRLRGGELGSDLYAGKRQGMGAMRDFLAWSDRPSGIKLR